MSKCKDVLSFSCNRNGRPDLCYVVKLIHHDLWREPPNDRFFQTKPETSCRHGRTALQGGRFLPRLGAISKSTLLKFLDPGTPPLPPQAPPANADTQRSAA